MRGEGGATGRAAHTSRGPAVAPAAAIAPVGPFDFAHGDRRARRCGERAGPLAGQRTRAAVPRLPRRRPSPLWDPSTSLRVTEGRDDAGIRAGPLAGQRKRAAVPRLPRRRPSPLWDPSTSLTVTEGRDDAGRGRGHSPGSAHEPRSRGAPAAAIAPVGPFDFAHGDRRAGCTPAGLAIPLRCLRYSSGRSRSSMPFRPASSHGGSWSVLPSRDGSSSTEKPGPSVAISINCPSGARK